MFHHQLSERKEIKSTEKNSFLIDSEIFRLKLTFKIFID